MKLRDGSESLDPRLGRIKWHDPRSKLHPVSHTMTIGLKPRSYSWRCTTWLDQGQEGSCVGHGVAHELAARPVEERVTHEQAVAIYHAAQKIDEWPGEAYEGTSVTAGVKVAQKQGHFKSYTWAYNLNDLALGVGYSGPAVLGIDWYQGMMDVDDDGYIRDSGSVVGGHCILCMAVDVKQSRFTLHNSWGKSWGRNGRAYVSFDVMANLIGKGGEACFFHQRKWWAVVRA
jgi:hypothetical protein